MPGIHPICPYPNFSTNDVEIFEKSIREWHDFISEKRCGDPMIIFDENEFAFRDKSTKEKIKEVPQGEKVAQVIDVYQVVLNIFTFTYIRPYGRMCIMFNIRETKTQRVIYHMPLKWDGVELWMAR